MVDVAVQRPANRTRDLFVGHIALTFCAVGPRWVPPEAELDPCNSRKCPKMILTRLSSLCASCAWFFFYFRGTPSGVDAGDDVAEHRFPPGGDGSVHRVPTSK
jgi:hypothetical protein